jgi:GNAT superfamily N-acetyltransferase
MKYYLLKTYKNIYNNKLYELYVKNYYYDKQFTPDYRYNCIIKSSDIWFHLINDSDDIIAICSVSINLNFYEIKDVFVEEKFRGNNYATLLLINVLNSFDNFDNFRIFAYKCNIAAIKTYEKIFGKPKLVNKDKVYFYLN